MLGEYAPLVMYLDPFLWFTRLADDGGLDEHLDTEKNLRVALAWTHGYRVLGLTVAQGSGRLKADTRGGEGTPLKRSPAKPGLPTTSLYSMKATAPDGPDVEGIAPFIAARTRLLHADTRNGPGLAMNAVTVQEKCSGERLPSPVRDAWGAGSPIFRLRLPGYLTATVVSASVFVVGVPDSLPFLKTPTDESSSP